MKLGSVELGSHPIIVGVITDPRNKKAVRAALKVGLDAVELRVDHFAELEIGKINDFIGYIKREDIPVILTVRKKDEGGKYQISDARRLEIFSGLTPYVDAVDIELSSKRILKAVVKKAKRLGKRVIISYHNFHRTPSMKALDARVAKGKLEGADIVKIATMATDYKDLRMLAGITLAQRNIITIAMGEKGILSRIFLPILGSLLTYAPVDDMTAPGQLSIRELRNEFRRYYL